MVFRFGAMALVLIMATLSIACQKAEPLTLEEYARWCGQVEEEVEVEEADNWGGTVDAAEVGIKEYGSVVPPKELKAFHGLRRSALQSMRDFAKEQNPNEPVNVFAFIGSPGLIAAGMAIGVEEEKLSTQVRKTLDKTGCI